MKPLNRILFSSLAYINIALGVAGTFIPLLPTTPFLLLAVILLTKSNPKMAQKLINHRLLGVYIRSYLKGDPLPMGAKLRMIFVVCVTMTLSIIYATDNIYIRCGLAVIGIAVSSHILMLRMSKKKLE